MVVRIVENILAQINQTKKWDVSKVRD